MNHTSAAARAVDTWKVYGTSAPSGKWLDND